MQNWVLPKKYPILLAAIKNGYYPRNTHIHLFLPLKPITYRMMVLFWSKHPYHSTERNSS